MENLFKLNSNENIIDIVDKYEEILLEPYEHVNENKGKGFRNYLIKVYNNWMKLEKVEVEFITNLTQWLHTATLLLDDIQDGSNLRRGNPAAHVIYGVSRTIAATNSSVYKYFYKLMTYESAELRVTSLHTARRLLEGQTMEIYWRDHFVCPSEDEYFEMASKKTGQVFVALSTFMKFFTKTNVDLKKVSLLFGIYFQLTDDYRGLNSNVFSETKGFCDDIREGKFIFPIIHAINSRPNDKRIIDIMKMHTNDVHLKKKCLKLLEEFGSMEYTRNKIMHFKNLIMKEMEKYELNENFKQLFELQNYAQ